MCVYLILFFFFFFQAEDGIRDGTVTGVQTCALPILAEALWRSPQGSPRSRSSPPRPRASASATRTARSRSRWSRSRKCAGRRAMPRSEERRVGKECRSRWSRYHEKKKEGENEDAGG